MPCHDMIYHTIWYTYILLQEFFLVLFLLASFLARRMSHVAYRCKDFARNSVRITRLAINETVYVLRDLQFNDNVLRSQRQRVTKSTTACYEVNDSVLRGQRQRVTRST